MTHGADSFRRSVSKSWVIFIGTNALFMILDRVEGAEPYFPCGTFSLETAGGTGNDPFLVREGREDLD